MNKKPFYITSTLLFFALAFLFFSLLSSKEGGIALVFCPKEIEYFGEKYRVVKIGDRCWMAQNLRTIKYLDGTEIPRFDSDSEWEGSEIGAYSVYPNEEVFVKDEAAEGGCGIASTTPTEGVEGEEEVEEEEVMGEDEVIRKFGMLYNFHAVNNALGLCPNGWSVPSHEDWTALERALCTSSTTCERDFPLDTTTIGERGTNEGSNLAGYFDLWYGGVLKENKSFDESGFDALPGGFRDGIGPFSGQGSSAYFWSSVDSEGGSWVREIHNYKTGVLRQNFNGFLGGMSVRCVKDN